MSPSRTRPTPWLWRDDEEMAKKDDDLRAHRRAGHHHVPSGQWQSNRVPRRSVFARRIVCAAVLGVLFFVVYKTFGFGSSSLESWSPDRSNRDDSAQPQKAHNKRPDKSLEPSKSYSGPIRFPHLGISLNSITHTDGHAFRNKNVLFATASLRSASTLLPMACQMAKEGVNYVHFAFAGRSDIPMQDLLKINGVDGSCSIITHDARPSEAGVSTETRMALASARALYHINSYMHPQAILLDTTSAEEAYFLTGFRDQVRATKSALIELPERAPTRLSWVAKLDASALAAWNKVHFDIMIHAPPSGTANLGRLLSSLHRVDLAGLSVPHLTIELPANLARGTSSLLSKFQWPPPYARPFSHPQMLTLQHRIPQHRMNPEERSVRFLESFWPRNPALHHVLILSPQTEVGPQFLHYAKYSILNQRFSSRSSKETDTRLMAMSFSIPATFPDATKPFKPPQPSKKEAADSRGGSFLWQASTSDAVLFLGSKWIELHGFVSQILEKQEVMSATPKILAKKEVSKKYPAWMEYVSQLARLRGYYTMYPSEEIATSLVGVHGDLTNTPEEYQEETTAKEEEEWYTDGLAQKFDPSSSLSVFPNVGNIETQTQHEPLPLLTWDGEQVDIGDLDQQAFKLVEEFRREVGQCSEKQLADLPPPDPSASDLFCEKTE